MTQTDQYLQKKYPDKYAQFLAVHTISLRTIRLTFIKRIRRYGTVTINLIDLDGNVLDRFTFVLVNKKETEGMTLQNDQEFLTIYEAWGWYEKKIVELFNELPN
jgi:hypothetical protein